VPVDQSLTGRTFGPTPPYDVTHERVAEFAAATQTPYDEGGPAPVTFPIVVAFAAMRTLMEDPEVGIALHRVVHGEQRFAYQRPVRAGDVLTAELTVDTLRQIGGNDIVGTTSAITDAEGRLVCTAKATLIHRGEA
jgi:ribulose 1,5-bisphosphate carboxylase large subunit-like protein